MIQQVLNSIDFSLCAEIALVLFFGLFVVLSVRTLLADRRTLQQYAADAIDDRKETQR